MDDTDRSLARNRWPRRSTDERKKPRKRETKKKSQDEITEQKIEQNNTCNLHSVIVLMISLVDWVRWMDGFKVEIKEVRSGRGGGERARGESRRANVT